jgi:hypothetical protein
MFCRKPHEIVTFTVMKVQESLRCASLVSLGPFAMQESNVEERRAAEYWMLLY